MTLDLNMHFHISVALVSSVDDTEADGILSWHCSTLFLHKIETKKYLICFSCLKISGGGVHINLKRIAFLFVKSSNIWGNCMTFDSWEFLVSGSFCSGGWLKHIFGDEN